jgi:uncharacterized delta-60 repeat protein
MEFTATGKAFGNLSLGFAPASRTVLTVVDLQGTNPISGRLDDLPHGKVIEAEYEGTIYRFLVNYKGGSGNDLVLHLIEPGLIDPTFSADINDGVVAVAIQPDEKVLTGGSFTAIAGRPARRIARLNRDGSHDGTFKAGVNGFVEGVAVQGDGKILVSGAFTEASGEERRGIVRFLPDGRVDPSFQCNAGPIVNRLLILNSGKILIGGRIDEVNGTAVKNLVLLNGDGSMDSSFACNVEATSGTAAVYAMTELSDGNLLIGGTFSRVGGISKPNFAKISEAGALDTSFSPNPSGTVSCTAVLPDGRILIGGSFTFLSGSSRIRFTRLNANGTVDPTFLSTVSPNNTVTSVALQSDGKIVIGGFFTVIHSRIVYRIARLHPNGGLDTTFVASPNDLIYTAVIAEDGTVYAGGNFTEINAFGVRGVARLQNDQAYEDFGIADDILRWNRSGSGAEMRIVEILFSPDGRQWNPIGSASRVTGGWEFSISPFSTPGFFRARGPTVVSNRGAGYADATLLHGRSMTSLESWRNQYFGYPTNEFSAADQSDGDCDGNPNLIEYAFSTDPLVSDALSSPGWSLVDGTYEFHLERSALTPDVALKAEWSTTMKEGEWHLIPNSLTPPHFRFNVAVDGNPAKFFRIRAVNP